MTLALAGVIIVSIGGSDGDSAVGNRSGSGATRTAECTPGAEKAVEAGYYVLKEGEGFSDVAEKTCLDVDRIERLNPNLDPIALPARGCVDLVERGCKTLATQG